jgi:hypothetical protein
MWHLLTNGGYDSVPIGDIFPESWANPSDGDGLLTTLGENIIHSEVTVRYFNIAIENGHL